MASENVKRFAVKSDSDIDLLLKEAVPMNTRKSTDMWVGVFQKFCKEQDIDLDLATCSATELNSALCKFYPSLRMKSGGVYRKASYLASRGAIHRKTQELKRSFNLFKSEEFTQSHRVLDATLKANKEQGLEPAVKHKEALTIEDRKKVQAFFADVLESNDPVKLTMYVWYAMTMHFGLRGHEVQVRLKKSDLEFKQDDSGECVVLSTDFASKNCPGGIAGREFATVGRVNDPRQVAAMRLLLEKVHPDVDRIFQRARTGPVKETDKTWFTRQALGHNLLGSMMERISERAGLSKKYTNHCVRATAVTILKENGVEDRKVCLVTGHKSEKSLEHYNRPTTSECSDLAQYLDGKDPRKTVSIDNAVKTTEAAGSSSDAASVTLPESSAGSSCEGFNLFAQGATFNNLTINLHQAHKRKLKLSTRSQVAAKKRVGESTELSFSSQSSEMEC